MSQPVAPWALTGESLVCMARCRGSLAPLPWGLDRMPGPVLVMAAAYSGSPVGSYLELMVGEPARLGLRPGWCITTTVVDGPAPRLAGRANWGHPKQLGTLVWRRDGSERELHWVERDLIVRGRPGRVPFPFLVPVRTLQRRSDGPVVVPGRLRGRGRPARVDIAVPPADDLAPLAGRHPGIHVAGMRFLLPPARSPVGRVATLLAPLRAPEPAISSALPGRLAQR